MNISKKEKTIIFLAVISFILLVIIYKWANYLSNSEYIQFVPVSYNSQIEGFSTGKTNTVNLPINTSYSCKNKCGPTARCSITGEQCLADIDCRGCQPYSPPLKKTTNIRGDDDAGIMTTGVTPTYSVLTSDIGTTATIFNNKNTRTPMLSNGVNTWRKQFNRTKTLFDSKFSPPNLQYMPVYKKQYTATGEFIDNGPLASNSTMTEV
jgi:hypothetical protein